MAKIGVGIYGLNGHQIHRHIAAHPQAQWVAAAGCDPASLAIPGELAATVRLYPTLDAMLADGRVELVSLCSPRRCDQANDAIKCLEAGRHVYAEKPCALSESDLDRILATARQTGRRFHEMAGTALAGVYRTMTKVVRQGTLGQVVQVWAQKSYPYHDARPQDEDVDGGLIAQCAVHAVRLIEQVGQMRVADVTAFETTRGNPVAGGQLRIAATLMMRLEGGGIGSVVANYLNPRGMGVWGNDHLRVFGTKGFIESIDGGQTLRLIVGQESPTQLDISESDLDYFDLYVGSLHGTAEMPMSLEDELHPTRIVLRAKAAADQHPAPPPTATPRTGN